MKAVLRPGLLVALSTRVEGGIEYDRRDISERTNTSGTEIAIWETERKIADKLEYEKAQKARGKATTLIRSQCAKTPFGLMCSESREDLLDNAIRQAEALIDGVNATLRHSTITVRVIKGRVADSDVEAARAISGEVRSMLEEMQRAIAAADPEATRAAATALKEIGRTLDPSLSAKVSDAIKGARAVARAVTKRVVKEGEQAATVLTDFASDLASIDRARMAFLDIDLPAVDVASLPAIDMQRMSEVEIEDSDEDDEENKPADASGQAIAASGDNARQIELS